mmetsp:Transcript_25862/g.58300  ORF Transcript_25862/g.58300 Transcript_25862/m.58300 type:complete len:351 (-) Transcript_25862:829-1881(-)
MNELQKRAGHDEVAGAPAAAKAPQKLTDVAAAIKIAELQAGLEALKQGHSVVVDMLNAKVNSLRAENDSQKREITGLNSAFQWAYNYKEIPRRHWLEQGHSEEYADAMENLLGSMKENIQTLSLGTVLNDSDHGEKIIKIDFNLNDEQGNYVRADHDELLMPHWKEFAAALRHWSEYHADGKCLKVEIIYIELPKVVLDILRPAFEESRIENVFFENSHHTGDMADFAKKVLQSNHFTKEVYFGTIKFTQEDVKTLCSAIKSRNMGSQSIKNLALCDCFDGGIDAHTLGSILTSVTSGSAKEVTLDLRRNMMTSREAGVIARFLTSNEVQVDNPHSFHLACLSRLTLVVF